MIRASIVLALCLGLTLAACQPGHDTTQHKAAASAVTIGGPFNLIDTARRPVNERTLKGKPTAIFFGFTYCPEVCPTTLAAMTQALKTLGPKADRLNVVFVSVDPERDTPEQMKEYLSNFDPRIQGFTGTPEQVAATAKGYRVYYQKVAIDKDAYTMDHSAAVYLFDKRGEFIEPIAYGSPPDKIAERLNLLLAGGSKPSDPLGMLRRATDYCLDKLRGA